MRCQAQIGEILPPLAFLGLGSLILMMVAVASWQAEQGAITASVGLILTVWLGVFARFLRRPIAVTLIGERRLRFTRLIGSFEQPVRALRLVTALREKDGWRSVKFYFDRRSIETWPLHQLSRLIQMLQTVQPTIEVRNTEERGSGSQSPPHLSTSGRRLDAPSPLAQAVHDRPRRLPRPIPHDLRRSRPPRRSSVR